MGLATRRKSPAWTTISGVSRSVSNLGSSMGTAIAGTIVVADASAGNSSYVAAMIVLGGIAIIGLVAAIRLPANVAQTPT